METPKIGIYMPAYNHGKYIRAAVDSIINQTYTNWELFIVNDGSTDETDAVLRQYEDERIHYYLFKENTRYVGAANFLQKLLKQMDFDYIADLASDDMWREDKLEKQVDYLQRHPEYKACFTWDKLIFEEESGDTYRDCEDYSHVPNSSRFEWLLHFFRRGNCLNACSMLVDKELFYELDRMNQNYIQIGDFRLWFKIAMHVPFYILEEELTYYRRHGSNLSTPTVEIVARTANEFYAMFAEIMRSFDPQVFRRAFYPLLPYAGVRTGEELAAEAFILCLGSEMPSLKQIALDIYFGNCSNERFISILETRYFFMSRDFIDLTGNSGLIFEVNYLVDHVQLTHKQVKDCRPANILLDVIDSGRLDEAFLKEAAYSMLFDLLDMTHMLEGGLDMFDKIKAAVSNVRQKRMPGQGGRKILFLIAEDSLSDIGEFLSDIHTDSSDEYMAAYIRTKVNCFRDETPLRKGKLPENMREIQLYKESEHCHSFLQEEGESADIIYFIDCLDERYEAGGMLAGYPLSVEAGCLLRREEYDRMLEEEGRLLAMMQEIMVYDG